MLSRSDLADSRSRVSLGLSAAILLPLLGCGTDPGAGPRSTLLDSAGVTIVENSGDVGEDRGGWGVDSTPLLSIGSFQGDSLSQLFRIQGALRLADGSIALANGGSGEIRVYGPDGRFVAAHGRKGEGPGEYQMPTLAGKLGGDTLVVVDVQLRRISLVDAREGFLRSAAISEELGGGIFPQGMFQDRSIVVGGGFYWSSGHGGQLTEGYTRRETSYLSSSLDGRLVTDFGVFRGSEFFMQILRSGDHMGMSARLIPFGKYAMQAVGPRHLFVASGDRWEVRAFAADGALERIIRLDRAPTPITQADLAAYIEEQVAVASDPTRAQEIRQGLAEMPILEVMPAFAGLKADALGYLWVERYRRPGDSIPVFDVLDPEGRVTSRVALPEPMEVLEIGADYILGLHRDELEVEYVRLYGLTRPRGS